MAVTSSILSSTRQRLVLHFFAGANGDSSTIQLTELRRAEEIAFSTTSQLTVNIAAAYLNCTDSNSGISVRRGGSSGTVVLDMHGQSEYPGQNALGDISIANTSSIFLNFRVPGMFVVDLRKVAGYAGPDTNVGV
jgi:hypothetical protein